MNFTSPAQEYLFRAVVREVEGLGYTREILLKEDYGFEDWFLPGTPERVAPAVAFGQTPLAYDSACFAVVLANGETGAQLINQYRALGAPRALEVREDCVVHWRMSRVSTPADEQQAIYPDQLREVFRTHAAQWSPASVLRAKSIAAVESRQTDFIDLGLIPALEQHVRSKLDPLLRDILHGTVKEYEQRRKTPPDPDKLYRLVFRSLTGKMMWDRRLSGFDFTDKPDATDLLSRVASFYNDSKPIINDISTQRVVIERLWQDVSLKNLSVEILAFIWENTLVSRETREELSIHATPPSIARYIVHRLPIQDIPQDERRIVEPCCGSGTFLIAALQRLRELLPTSVDPKSRHQYFTRMLSGFDVETFGLEVARSCLMLADFPNPNGWALQQEDVFEVPEKSPEFFAAIRKARAVLCNPPFGSFMPTDRKLYQLSSVHKPVEVVLRILANLHPQGMLGFVLPQQLLNGAGYRAVREQLVNRYDDIELVSLPDKVFEKSEHETVLLIANHPKVDQVATSIVHRKVNDHDWPSFNAYHNVTREDAGKKDLKEASEDLGIPDLQKIWKALADLPTIHTATSGEVHRGIEWNIPLDDNQATLISTNRQPGFKRGVPSAKRKFYSFQRPPVAYLCIKQEYRRGNAFDLPWEKPKVIMNAKRKSRLPWRIAAYADESGLICYQTFTCLWPSEDWTADTLAAVMNGPVASAFVASREGNRDITVETIKKIPVPRITQELNEELAALVSEYRQAVERLELETKPGERLPRQVLANIDALILKAYDLPPRFERELLDYFQGHGTKRPVPFDFGDYIPAGFRPCFSLADYLSKEFSRSTTKEFKKRRGLPSEDILRALRAAAKIEED